MLAALTAALIALPAPAAFGRAYSTTSQTIVDADRDNRLEPGPGEDHVVRQELGTASPTRTKTRVPLLFFGQFTDTHVVDEESPARVEFLDRYKGPFTSAYRAQEAMSAQVMNEMVRQMRNTTSPVDGRQIQLLVSTGDNSDNTQQNETRWFIDLLDGDTEVNPDSGVPGSCGVPPDHRYDGVRGGNEYYEPDASPGAEAGADNVDGPGYSPNQSENEREAERSSEVRDYPGLFERANEPFRAVGLDVPWYSVFGNHDALVQGNAPRQAIYDSLATGCEKPSRLSNGAEASISALAEGGFSAEETAQAYDIALKDMASGGGSPQTVPSDPRRHLLKKAEYMEEHCRTTGAPRCHGYERRVQPEMGYYSFSPRPRVRFIVLDTIAEMGGDGGNIDHTQFTWLHEELKAADQAKQFALVFAHHSLETMSQPPLSVFGAGDQGGDPNPAVHYGLGPDPHLSQPCALADPVVPPTLEETLRCLLLRHPSAVAFVNGHEHNNRINPFERREGAGPAVGGFWQINTAAHIDWPEQSRVIDVVDNRDGTLSLFGTILDHAAGPNPGSGDATDSSSRLASISRELSYNDPDSSNGEDGRGNARGSREDRNVELVLRSPY